MVQIIVGERGKGKTTHLLAHANDAVKVAHGNLVYVDKNQKRMNDLSNKVRLIDISEFPIFDAHEFLGFLCGIISQDWDLETMYIDSFLTVASLQVDELAYVLEKLDYLTEKFKVNFIITISIAEADLPENARGKVILSV